MWPKTFVLEDNDMPKAAICIDFRCTEQHFIIILIISQTAIQIKR